ncbi:MAG TPA: tetratricopeptide repeat protein [Myxococcales bacterium]|nr:tetratricopeptide repeat protein [Myxococcales bacterium]
MPDRESKDERLRELVALGREHFQRGDYPAAAGHLEQVVALGARFADVQHMLGVIYHQLGEFEPAQRAFEKALEINPDYTEAALNLAIVCNDLGQYDRARQVYGNAVGRAKSPQKRDANGDQPLDPYTRGKIANLLAAVGDGYLSVRRPSDAASEYRRALSLCPTFVDLRLKLAQALQEGGDLEGALAELRVAVQHSPAWLPARVALGTALYAGGRLDEAMAQWEEVLRADPQHRTAGMYLKLARSQAHKEKA